MIAGYSLEKKIISRTARKRTPKITNLQQARRAVKIVIGFTVLLFGGTLLMLPGPGVLIIVMGLAILGTEYVWAKKLMRRVGDGANNIKNSIFNNAKKITDDQ